VHQSPIFILGPHKSGTSLLRNIFDGHSNLFVIPIEAHFFQHLGYWIDYSIRNQSILNLDDNEILTNFIDWIKKSNIIPGGKADSDTRGFWDIELFISELHKLYNQLNQATTKELIKIYIKAMYKSLYNKDLSDNTRIVEKSVENSEFAMQLKKIFPKAKFIHIIRNPYSNLVSIRKFKSKTGYPFMKYIIESMNNNYYFLEKNKEVIDEDYYVLKYEDFVNDSEKKIKELANFANLKIEEILFKPTVQGELWRGNSTSNKEFSGISSDRLGKWKEEISPFEIGLINKKFDHFLEKYGYKYYKIKDNIYHKNKNENIKSYIANRLYYKYFV
jgi:hypothetical protein